jgi:hypothetical protein
MYLLEYRDGKVYRITANPEMGLDGDYVTKLPINLETLLERDLIEQESENSYILKGVN